MAHNVKILVVEDDALVPKNIKRTLHNMGYNMISIVATGKQALLKSKENSPDLVLIDKRIKGELNGVETVRQLRARFDIPIVYLIVDSNDKIVEETKEEEPSCHISNPNNENEFFLTIETALSKNTQDKNLEQALSKNYKRFHKLVDHISDGIVVQNENGIITFVSNSFLEMSGNTQDELIGHSSSEFLDEVDIDKLKNQITSIIRSVPDTYEVEWKRKDGKKLLMNVLSVPIHDEKGNIKERITILRDVTRFFQVEEELTRSHDELSNLYQHLHSIREKESKRISREIHDELGQALTALKMELFWLANRLPNIIKDKKQFIEKIKSMTDLVDGTIKEVQRIASELRPGILDDLGLVPAIEWQAQDFQKRTNIKCITDLDSDGVDFDAEFSTAIFRIFQEALTNVARHAEATKVKVSLKRKNSKLEMKIMDNGKGIKEKDIFSPRSLGFIGMRERLRPLDGELKLKGISNRGTTLAVNLPIRSSRVREDIY